MTQPDSYSQLKRDVFQFLLNQSMDDRIRAMGLDLVNQALRASSVQLTNQEKDSLAQEVMKDILLEILKEYQDVDIHKSS